MVEVEEEGDYNTSYFHIFGMVSGQYSKFIATENIQLHFGSKIHTDEGKIY